MQIKFFTDSVKTITEETKSEKNYYVEGYISTPELDQGNDMITTECLDDMVSQLKNGNIKMDVEHETWIKKPDIAIGKIVDATRDNHGVKVVVMMNKSHHRFDEVWNSIKNGFLDAFSIAYDVVDSEEVPNA